jgi:hypothetical protein
VLADLAKAEAFANCGIDEAGELDGFGVACRPAVRAEVQLGHERDRLVAWAEVLSLSPSLGFGRP